MPLPSAQNAHSGTPTGWIAPSSRGVRQVRTVVPSVQPAVVNDGFVGGREAPVGWQTPGSAARTRVEPRMPTEPRAVTDTSSPVGTSPAVVAADESEDDDPDDDAPANAALVTVAVGNMDLDNVDLDNVAPQRAAGPDMDLDGTDVASTHPSAVSRETADTGVADTPLAARIADEQRRRVLAQGTAVPRPAAPRVMTIANQKGGVGKTTTTVNVAAALAQSGLNVLVIDIDPQGNASTALGIPHHAEVPSIYDVITDDLPLAEVLQECPDIPGLWCAPATIDLAGAEIELVSLVARESRLKRAVDEHLASMSDEARFDYVLIDCPPSLGLLTVNAFVAAAEVFIPIQCEYYALEGLSQLLNNIGMIRRHLNPRLDVSTILLTMYDGRTNLSSNVADEVRSHFPDNVLRTQIPRSVRISEAPSYGQTVLTYDPSSSGALSYLEAAKELALRPAPSATPV